MANFPLAYHITFGTYGTRLHGDYRATVVRTSNAPGTPVFREDPLRLKSERDRMQFNPVLFQQQQREFIEASIPSICQRGAWEYRIAAAGPDHVHVLLSAAAESGAVRKWLKRWLGETLSERWPLAPGRSWWADGGSVKSIWQEDYLQRAFEYIRRQRATRE
jgi:REP element-mobilizing transposase RayT